MISDLANLIHAVAWPATILIVIFLLRQELRNFIGRLTDSISQAAQISITAKGLEIKLAKQIAAVNSRVTAVQATQEQVKTAVGRKRPRKSDEGHPIPKALNALANKYLELEIPDYRERLRQKNKMARNMGEAVVEAGVSRDSLVKSDSEGLLLAFAAAVVAQPEEQDLDRIVEAASKAKRLHVRYWLVVALSVLINTGFVDKDLSSEVERVLDELNKGADPPLAKFIQDTAKLLDSIVTGEIQAGV